MEEITLPHLPQYPLRVCLFKHTKNAPFLRQQLLDGNHEFEYAFLDASVLFSRKQVLAACFRAIIDLVNNRLKSRNVHSEIVFALSPNNNIAESFRRFGISDESQNILAIKIGGDASQIDSHLSQNVDGDRVSFSDASLASMCDHGRLRKIYRVDVGQGQAEVLREAEAFVTGTIALKGS